MRKTKVSQNLSRPGRPTRPAKAPNVEEIQPGTSLEAYRKRVMEEKRTAALDAASECFLRLGYDRTTLAEVARVAKISTGTLFNHFPSKAELFGGIMERMWEADPHASAVLPSPDDPKSGLLAIGQDYAARLRQPTTEALFRVVIAEARRFPELAQSLFERGKAPYLRRLEAYLKASMTAGKLNVKDVPLAGRQFLGMINDVIFWPRFLDASLSFSDPEVEHVIEEAVLTMMARYSSR